MLDAVSKEGNTTLTIEGLAFVVLDINLFLEVSIFIIHLKRHSTICVTQSSAQGLGCRFDLKWRVVNVDQCRPTRPLKVVAKHPVLFFFFSKHAVL